MGNPCIKLKGGSWSNIEPNFPISIPYSHLYPPYRYITVGLRIMEVRC